MKVSITYDSGFAAVAERIRENIEEIIAAGAEGVAQSARDMCPVDTGKLQSSINVSVNGSSADISADTDYAAYVEFGTSKAAPQPYLVPALLLNSESVLSAIAAGLKAL